MPNWCFVQMRVKGSEESKRKLVDLFLSSNSVENEKKNRYFARTWTLNYPDVIEEQIKEEVSIFDLEVAWSIYSCMISGYPNGKGCPTIFEVSKELNLDIQIAGYEQGMCFREFYHIKNGELILDLGGDFPEADYDDNKLYCEYVKNWKPTDKSKGPKDFEKWYDEEYMWLRDEWYVDVFNLFTDDFALN